jgi:hypothetical protein
LAKKNELIFIPNQISHTPAPQLLHNRPKAHFGSGYSNFLNKNKCLFSTKYGDQGQTYVYPGKKQLKLQKLLSL